MKNIFKAFTLAEILVAMFMFAMLAVMLIPKVTQNAERELFVTQTKKVQNDIQQAFLMMVAHNGGSIKGFCSDSSCLLEQIKKHLESHTLFSSSHLPSKCTPNSKAKLSDQEAQACNYHNKKPLLINNTDFTPTAHEDNSNNFLALNLKNGATVSLYFNPACNGTVDSNENNTIRTAANTVNDIIPHKLCGYMEVDVNAGKVPNTVGKDIHYFWITSTDGIVPFGEFDEFKCGDFNTTKNEWNTKPKNDDTENHQLGCTSRMISKSRIDYY